MRLVIQTTENEQVYMTYDVASGVIRMTSKMRIPSKFAGNFGGRPAMTLLSADRATIIPANDRGAARRSSKLFTASIGGSRQTDQEEQEQADGGSAADACDKSSFILESLHIAFMQQEALRFEQNEIPLSRV